MIALQAMPEKFLLQTKQEVKVFWLNTVGGVMRAFGKVSGTSLENQLHFEQQVMELKQKKMEHLFFDFLSKLHFGKNEQKNVSLYKPAPSSASSFYSNLMSVIFMGLIVCLAGILIKSTKPILYFMIPSIVAFIKSCP